jgi:hypothetical protein
MKTLSQIANTSLRSFAANGMIMVLALCSVLALCCFAPQDARDWTKVRKLDAVDAEAFGATEPHSSVLITGMLDGNPTRTPDGLIAYVKQRLDVPDDGGNRYRETWTTIAQVWPPLSLQVDGQHLRIAQADSVEWGGNLHAADLSLDSSKRVNGIAKESVQVMGFKNGDQVTVAGSKGSNGNLIPTRIYGGDRVDLLRELGRDALVGYVLGIAFILVALWIVFRRITAQARERQPSMSKTAPSGSS